MTATAQPKIYVKRDWTEQVLLADGFLSYRPVKRLTMARKLTPEEAPMSMRSGGNIITAEAGYWIAYWAGKVLKQTLDDYKPRPIEPDIFATTYHRWDVPNWKLTPTETHLRRLGCQAYYKIASIRAKQLEVETWIQGIESDKPLLAPKGDWLCVGMEGEPWNITDAWFHAHYLLPGRKTSTRGKG